MPNELSGGMRKRAGFARALVLDPDIVLFDEPDSGLDPVRTALLCELIQEIHEENGGAYVVITHDIMSAKRVAEYIAVLWKGRIVESGPAEELFDSDNQFVRQFLSGRLAGPAGHGVDAALTLSPRSRCVLIGRRARRGAGDATCFARCAASGHEYTLIFENAGQLVQGRRRPGRRPRASARSRTIELTDDNQAAIKVERRGAVRAAARGHAGRSIRLTSLSGIANRYVALTPGPGRAQELRDGATLNTASTTTVVDLDQLFNTLDPRTRERPPGRHRGLRDAVRGQGRRGRRGDGVLQPAALDRAPAGQRADRGRGAR